MTKPNFGTLTENILSQFSAICGSEYVITDENIRQDFGHDETEDFNFLPDVVVKPASSDEVAAILKVCNMYKIPVTPSGARTGLSGGALPVFGGVNSQNSFHHFKSSDETFMLKVPPPNPGKA